MRLNHPVGTWLLLWPCWWSIALASEGKPSLLLLFAFAAGALLMRSAGCIINDMADRELDRQVERTRTRPLASGELSMTQALVLLALLLVLSGAIAAALGPAVIMWGLLSLIPVGLYPFMKRISWWPQLFLGLTFNWGALMGWAAVRGVVEWPAVLIYAGGIFWTLGYDTIYAHQDKKDDARIGIKSTALRLGIHTPKAVGFFYLLATLFWAVAGYLTGANPMLYAFLILTQLHFGWQLCRVELDNPRSCQIIFKSNIVLGGLVFLGFLAASLAIH